MISRPRIERILGKTFADKLDETVFNVGAMKYSRRQMVDELGCANFIAAIRLQKALRRLGISTPAQLNKLDPFSLARVRGIGESSLFVAMCILDHNQYNVIDWWEYKDNVAKFSTFKHHAMQRANRRKQEVA